METGGVPSKISIEPRCPLPSVAFIGIRETCRIAEIGPRMEAAMAALDAWAASCGAAPTGKHFAVYHRFDPVKDEVDVTTCYPIAEVPTPCPAGMTVGERPALTTYAVRHRGSYRHLGNAWAVGMMRERAKCFRLGKQHPPFEVYDNDPAEALSESEIAATLHFPLKD